MKAAKPAMSLLVVAALAWPAGRALAGDGGTESLLRETFRDLTAWEPVVFERIPRHTRFSVVRQDDMHVLKADSDASASGLRWTRTYDVREYPRLRWRWKVSNVFEKGDVTRKSGDDCPVRVYVMFALAPGEADWIERLGQEAAELLHGDSPPHSALSYIWASKPREERILANPYSARVKMVVLEAGRARVGQWIEEDVDVAADYREAFGEAPPGQASLAIMNDSDDTGEKATSYVSGIEIYRGENP